MSLGRALSWMPDYNKAKIAAAKIFNLLDREPKINRTGMEDVVPVCIIIVISFHRVLVLWLQQN